GRAERGAGGDAVRRERDKDRVMFARNAHPEVQLLDGIELFRGCTQRELRAVAPLLCPVDVQPGSVLTREDDFASQLLVVVAGTARSMNAARDSVLLGL